MVKDVIREYDEHFPEIIERATYTLEKVGGGVGGVGGVGSCRPSRPSSCPVCSGSPLILPPPLILQCPRGAVTMPLSRSLSVRLS